MMRDNDGMPWDPDDMNGIVIKSMAEDDAAIEEVFAAFVADPNMDIVTAIMRVHALGYELPDAERMVGEWVDGLEDVEAEDDEHDG